MVVFTIECVECGETRTARLKSGDVLPFEPACAECLSLEFVIVDEEAESVNKSETKLCSVPPTD